MLAHSVPETSHQKSPSPPFAMISPISPAAAERPHVRAGI